MLKVGDLIYSNSSGYNYARPSKLWIGRITNINSWGEIKAVTLFSTRENEFQKFDVGRESRLGYSVSELLSRYSTNTINITDVSPLTEEILTKYFGASCMFERDFRTLMGEIKGIKITQVTKKYYTFDELLKGVV